MIDLDIFFYRFTKITAQHKRIITKTQKIKGTTSVQLLAQINLDLIQ